MEYEKITNLLGNISANQLPRYITKKWIEVYDESDRTYNTNKDVRFKTPQLRNDLCDWSDAYIVVTGKITVTDPNNNTYSQKLALKNNAPFFSCVTRINNIVIDDAQDLDIVMPLHICCINQKTIKKHQDLCGIIIEMNQFVVHKTVLIIQSKIKNLLTTKKP